MNAAHFRPTDAVDFIVIGAGAAGGVIAKELSTAGFRIVVLEQGPWLREGDFQHDEVSVMYRSALTNDYKKQPNVFRKTAGERANRQPAVEYGRMVGGGPVHFTPTYCPLAPHVSSPTGGCFAALSRTPSLRSLRLLRELRMRNRRQVKHARRAHSSRCQNGPVRGSSELLRTQDRSWKRSPGAWRHLL